MPPTIDWPGIAASLDERGYATIPGLIDPAACGNLAGLYDDEARFRSRVVMQRHRFGQGEYKYLRYPLPELVAGLRQELYPGARRDRQSLAPAFGKDGKFPPSLDAYLAICHKAGQVRPTPLILKYGPGDYNCLHQDLYGDLVFPLQLTVLLTDPGAGFTGGEFLLVEQRPRSQSKGRGGAAGPGRGGDLSGPSPPGRGHARHLSGDDAARRQPGAFRPTLYPRHHLS